MKKTMKDKEGTRTEEGEEAVRGKEDGGGRRNKLRKGTVGTVGTVGEGTGKEGKDLEDGMASMVEVVEVAVGDGPLGDGPQWTGEYDDYDKWFQTVMPGKDPQATLDGVDGNGWNTWYVLDRCVTP